MLCVLPCVSVGIFCAVVCLLGLPAQASCEFGSSDGVASPLEATGVETFTIAGAHAFTSTRKRMSVVVENSDGTATVY